MLTVSAAALGLTACGSTATADEISYDESYLESVADFLIGNWDGMSDEQIAQYAEMDAEDAQSILDNYGLPFTAEAFTTAFSGYMGNEEELGAYVSTDGYEVSTDGEEITLVAHLTYEQRTADLSIVFNKKSVAQSVTLDPSYTLGEIFTKNSIPAGCISLECRCGIIPYHTYNLVRAYLLFGHLSFGSISGCYFVGIRQT